MPTIVNPNSVLDAIKTILDAALVPTFLQGGYDYRTQPARFDKYYVVAFMGQLPQQQVATKDMGGHQNFGLAVFVKHDKTDAGLRSAERLLNDTEHAIIESLNASRDTAVWHKIIFPYTSLRPRAPVESPEIRIAEIPFRVILK